MSSIKFVILLAFMMYADAAIGQAVKAPVPDGNYYIVRHAEKDTGANPGLTTAGYLRAGDLYRTLKSKKISRVYVTQFPRTELTADSLSIHQKAALVHYLADDSGDDLMKKLASLKEKNVNVLIVGHSNTIPAIMKRLGITGLDIYELPEDEFDNLLVVAVKNKKVSLKWLKYGKPSPATSSQ